MCSAACATASGSRSGRARDAPPHDSHHPEVRGAQRRASKGGVRFHPSRRASRAPQDDGGVRAMKRPSPVLVRWLILLGLLVFWELMPRTGIIPELFLPSLSKTVAVLIKDWREYASELAVTLYEVAFAMLIACGFGILCGALVGGIALLRSLLLPVFSSMYAVPIVILYPIFTAWFGIGSQSKIIFAGA